MQNYNLYAHRQALLAACATFFKIAVQIKRHPGQIAQIFQKSKQREKDRHWRQHYRNDPSQSPVCTMYQHIADKRRGTYPAKKICQSFFDPEQAAA